MNCSASARKITDEYAVGSRPLSVTVPVMAVFRGTLWCGESSISMEGDVWACTRVTAVASAPANRAMASPIAKGRSGRILADFHLTLTLQGRARTRGPSHFKDELATRLRNAMRLRFCKFIESLSRSTAAGIEIAAHLYYRGGSNVSRRKWGKIGVFWPVFSTTATATATALRLRLRPRLHYECACDCSSATPIAPGLTCNPSSGPTRAMYCLAPEGSIAPPLSANACAASGVGGVKDGR